MTLLALRGIGMEYGAIRALAEVDYTVASGEIVAAPGSITGRVIAPRQPKTGGRKCSPGSRITELPKQG